MMQRTWGGRRRRLRDGAAARGQLRDGNWQQHRVHHVHDGAAHHDVGLLHYGGGAAGRALKVDLYACEGFNNSAGEDRIFEHAG